jgi:hypothetical protein
VFCGSSRNRRPCTQAFKSCRPSPLAAYGALGAALVGLAVHVWRPLYPLRDDLGIRFPMPGEIAGSNPFAVGIVEPGIDTQRTGLIPTHDDRGYQMTVHCSS